MRPAPPGYPNDRAGADSGRDISAPVAGISEASLKQAASDAVIPKFKAADVGPRIFGKGRSCICTRVPARAADAERISVAVSCSALVLPSDGQMFS